MLNALKLFFRPPEAKASRVAQLIQLESGGRARWTPRDYAALAREGYVANAVVHRAVKLVAENVAAVPLLVTEGTAVRDRHPLLSLLARPNPRQERASFFEAVCGHLLLAGNAYVEAVTLDGEPAVRELYALRPDRMRVVPGSEGWPEAYEYTVAGRTVRFEQSGALPPILHLTQFHPLDDHYGLSSIEPAAIAIEVDILSGSTVLRTLVVTTPEALYSAADEIVDFGAPQANLHVRVTQLSATVGRGYVNERTLTP